MARAVQQSEGGVGTIEPTIETTPVESRKAIDFKSCSLETLCKTDPTALTSEELPVFAGAVHARLAGAFKTVVVDNRDGQVYLGGRQVGNFNRPSPHKAANPFKAKEDHIDATGEVHMPSKMVSDGHEKAQGILVASIRFNLAGITGNNVNLLGQKEKTPQGAANAAGASKSGLL